jgi:hypothetical protein
MTKRQFGFAIQVGSESFSVFAGSQVCDELGVHRHPLPMAFAQKRLRLRDRFVDTASRLSCEEIDAKDF